jgi:hypothetical protein
MHPARISIASMGLIGLCVAIPAQSADSAAQKHKPVMITRLFTGPDGQTHSEEIEAGFAPAGGNDVYKLMANSGAAGARRRLAHRATASICRHDQWPR